MSLFLILSSWMPVLLWAGLIFYLSSIPHLDTGWGGWDLLLRKTAHMVEYATLALLLRRALKKTSPQLHRRTIVTLSFLLAVLYAASDEFHQTFVPGRLGCVQDVLLDSCGAALGLLVYKYLPGPFIRVLE